MDWPSLPFWARGKKAKERRTTALVSNLDDLVEGTQAKTTKYATKYAVNVFKVIFAFNYYNKIHKITFCFFFFKCTIKLNANSMLQTANVLKSNFTRPIACRILAVKCSKNDHLNLEECTRQLTRMMGFMANARNVSFRISLRWLTYIVNSVDKTKFSCCRSRNVDKTKQQQLSYNKGVWEYFLRAVFMSVSWKQKQSKFPGQSEMAQTIWCNISNTRDSVSWGYPNTKKRVENTTRSVVFLTKFEVFG